MKVQFKQSTGSIISSTGKYIRNNKVKSILLGLLLVVITYGVYRYAFASKNSSKSTSAQVQVTKGSIEVDVSGTGTIVPVESYALTSEASGKVQKLFIRNGTNVKAGDVLAILSNDSLILEAEKAKLDLEKARLDLLNSKDDAPRATVTANISGRIVNLTVQKGEDVNKNATMATIQDDTQLVFDMPVTATIAGKSTIGQKVEVFLPDSGETVEGRIIGKNQQVVSGYKGESRAYLKVSIPTSGNITSGTKAFGSITVNGKQVDALSVSTLAWIIEKQVKATIAGEVSQAYVSEGQVVKSGQKLFDLTNDTASGQQLIQQASYQQALLNSKDLEDQRTKLTVRAPIEGTISELDATIGDDVGTSSSSNNSSSNSSTEKSLGTIINSHKMEVSFPVDEVDIAKIKKGLTATINVDAFADKVFKGKVVEISEVGTITNNVSSFNVTISIENTEGLLKSGMTSNIKILVAKKENAVLIPIEALQEKGNRKYVFVPDANGSSSGKMKDVTVGLTNESYAEITEGLSEGDKILEPGQTTTTKSMFPGMGGGGNRQGGSNKSNSGSNDH